MKIEKSKVFYLIKRLSKSEIRQIHNFLQSPFFNQRGDVITLFDELVRQIGKSVEVEELFQKIYGKRAFSKRDLSLVMSYLFKLLEQYFNYKAVFTGEKQLENELQLVDKYQELKAPKLYQEKLKQIEQKHKKTVIQNAGYYAIQYQLLNRQFEFSSVERPSEEHHLRAISNALDINYIAQKLKQLCFSIAHRSVYKSNFKPYLIDAIIKHVEVQNLNTLPAIGIYYHIYRMFTAETPSRYFQLVKKDLLQHQNTFPQKEIRDIYMMMINYLIRFMNAGKMNYLEEAFELYKVGLAQNILLENDTITRFTFNNIVRIALKCKALDWANSFIEDYHSKLGKSYQKSFYHFGQASIAFEQKEYEKVLEFLQQFYSRDILLNLGAKTLLSKAYYELGEMEVLAAHLEAMYNYVQRNKILGYHRTNYLNIISYTNKLLQVNIYSKKELEILRRAMKEETTLTEKEWFLGCVEKLIV